MELSEFTNKVREQFIDGDEIEMGPETRFRDLGSWDSLTGMSILVMIKDEFDADLSVDDFKKQQTVQDLYDHIQTIKQ
jgi:acyl carrier protein